MVLAQGLERSHKGENCHLKLQSYKGSVRAAACFQLVRTIVGWPQFLAAWQLEALVHGLFYKAAHSMLARFLQSQGDRKKQESERGTAFYSSVLEATHHHFSIDHWSKRTTVIEYRTDIHKGVNIGR